MSDPHPWYPGGCDRLGLFGSCSECSKLLPDPAFKVERDDSHECQHCGAGIMWDVVGPDGVALGRGFSLEEDAEEFADELSWAYEAGRRKERDLMEQVLRDLLGDCRQYFRAELENNVDNYAFGGSLGRSYEEKRQSIQVEDLSQIEPLEALIARIDMALADNRGAGI